MNNRTDKTLRNDNMHHTVFSMDLSLLSRYRSHLMGLATLWIILLHSTAWFSGRPLAYLKSAGYSGVDGFLILSAMGLYFSWQKNDKDLFSFYKRRFIRILPAYWLIAVFRCFLEETGKRYFVLLAATLSFWVRDDLSMWFIAGITVLYLASPLFFKIMDSVQWKGRMILCFAAAFILGFLMKQTPQNVFFTRIPSFLIGFPLGKLVYENYRLTKKDGLLLASAFVVGMVCMVLCQSGALAGSLYPEWITRWYSALLFSIPLMLGCAALLGFLDVRQIHVPGKLLSALGSISLEVYLLFEVLLRFFRGSFLEYLPFEYHGIVYSSIIALLTFLCSYAVHAAVKRAVSFIR